MLRVRLAAWLRPIAPTPELSEGREAYHSDIRELRPEAWSTYSPAARGRDVERAMWLAGVSSRDFSEAVGIDLSPHLVTPVDDIVTVCRQRAETCEQRTRTQPRASTAQSVRPSAASLAPDERARGA